MSLYKFLYPVTPDDLESERAVTARKQLNERYPGKPKLAETYIALNLPPPWEPLDYPKTTFIEVARFFMTTHEEEEAEMLLTMMRKNDVICNTVIANFQKMQHNILNKK